MPPREDVVRITKVYTRTGDAGSTRLVGGGKVPKDDPRIEAYGTVDELNSVLGVVRSFLDTLPTDVASTLDEILASVQDDLFNVGTELATPADARWEGMYRVGSSETSRLEQRIDDLNETLPALEEFILPGGGRVGALLHQGRTVCRRAERCSLALLEVQPDVVDGPIPYLNRLSDLLFVAARFSAVAAGIPEVTWRNPAKRGDG
ncbi:MAG: cob(I)yrinic acid a,c-diamide adenosyltransferase [Myxococcales bacterium]|nr:cob(I)yrinic acid a,c-diamide adenosyltransferase [Myxococcales bacterium]